MKHTVDRKNRFAAIAALLAAAVLCTALLVGCSIKKAPDAQEVSEKAKAVINENTQVLTPAAEAPADSEEPVDDADGKQFTVKPGNTVRFDLGQYRSAGAMHPIKVDDKFYFNVGDLTDLFGGLISGDAFGGFAPYGTGADDSEKVFAFDESFFEDGKLEEMSEFFESFYGMILDKLAEYTEEGRYIKDEDLYRYDFSLDEEQVAAALRDLGDYISENADKFIEPLSELVESLLRDSELIDSLSGLFGGSEEFLNMIVEEAQKALKDAAEELKTQLNREIDALKDNANISGTMDYEEEDGSFKAIWHGTFNYRDGAGREQSEDFDITVSNSDDGNGYKFDISDENIVDIDSLLSSLFGMLPIVTD